MKLLYYNWLPFDEEEGRGGGVSLYLKDLIGRLINEKQDEIWFFSSGYYYDVDDTSLRYEEIPNIYSGSCRTFSIINSPVVSPAYLSFYSLDTVLNDTRLGGVYEAFLKEFGPFDVVHYHNLEGLSLSVINRHRSFRETAFIYTIHNYYAFCPQVNLWRDEAASCDMEDTGKECIICMREHVPLKKLARKKTYIYKLKRQYSKALEEEYKAKEKEINEEFYEEEHRELYPDEKERIIEACCLYRKMMVEAVNASFDLVIGVSKRTCDIAIRKGISPNLIRLGYIGTKATENRNTPKFTEKKADLSIIYMGYQRRDKGYMFLAEALNMLPESVSKRIRLTIAAKRVPNAPEVIINGEKFADFIYKDGYTRNEIKSMLATQDLGIIPSLWEDALPQVAIEMAANGVPVLSSDRGGASELSDDHRFIFRAGDIEDFIRHITEIAENPRLLNEYWNGFHALTTMERHISELYDIYRGTVR